jgi:hypothetical protein
MQTDRGYRAILTPLWEHATIFAYSYAHMTSLKPLSISGRFLCPYCSKTLKLTKTIWQGIHICVASVCDSCKAEIINDLPTGHAIYYPFQIDLKNNRTFGANRGLSWLGRPLLTSLLNPSYEKISIKKYIQIHKKQRDAVIVNCLDFMYGHCLLKLFNVERYKKNANKKKIIAIIPECIRWLVPSYVDEIWSIDIPLAKTRQYNIHLEAFIKKQVQSYKTVIVSNTNCHPQGIVISDFSNTQPALTPTNKTITFFWRYDRLWTSDRFINTLPHTSLIKKFLYAIEYMKIILLFLSIKHHLPDYKFMIVGIGKQMKFPSWIADHRIPTYNQQKEKNMCKIYAKSTLVIGTLGSHIILPAAHAFMTLELAHTQRTECFGQNMVIPSHAISLDPRLYYFRHRIIPSTTSIKSATNEIVSMLRDYQYSKLYFRGHAQTEQI